MDNLSLSWSPSGAYIAAGLGLDDGGPMSPGRLVVFTVDGETVWDSWGSPGRRLHCPLGVLGRALAVGLGGGQLIVYAFEAQGSDGEGTQQPQATVTVPVEKTTTVEAIREVTRTKTETETVTRTVTRLVASTLTTTTTAWETVTATRTVTVDPSPAAVGVAALVALIGALNFAGLSLVLL